MKKMLALLVFACCAVCGAAGEWSAKGSAVLTKGVNQSGNECIMAAGTGQGAGYGGLLLTLPLDLHGATAKDAIKLKVFQNLSWLTVMLRGKDGSVYRSVQLPLDGTEVVLPLDRKNWKTGKGAADDFHVYDDIVLYASFFKHPTQVLGITDFVVEKDGKELYGYHSKNHFPARKFQVFNLGLGGDNSKDVIKRQLDRAVKLKPTVAVVMVGTNDRNNPYKLISLDQYEKNLREITETLTAAGAKVILVTPPPCIESIVYKRSPREKIGNADENVRQVCSVMRRLADEKKYLLADFYRLVEQKAPLESAESYLRNPLNSGAEDGVHPTRDGYAALSRLLAEMINQNGLSKDRVVCLGDSITFGASMLGAGTAYGDSYPAQLAKLLNNEN